LKSAFRLVISDPHTAR
jgi:hypothetical protein